MNLRSKALTLMSLLGIGGVILKGLGVFGFPRHGEFVRLSLLQVRKQK
jgi:hypothetical protein